MRKLLLTTAAVAAAIGLAGCVKKKAALATRQPVTYASCIESFTHATGTFTDSRDGKTYKTVIDGGQMWMAENINYQTDSGSWCYDDKESKCEIYGRLYDRKTAKTACPTGWKLPDTSDWNMVYSEAVEVLTRCEEFKSESALDWSDASISVNETDDFGYLIMTGFRDTSGIFIDATGGSYWWMATESSDGGAYSWVLYRSGSIYFKMYDDSKNYGFSVRCVADRP